MENINKVVFIAALGILTLSLQLSGMDIGSTAPNMLLSLFVAASIFYFYEDTPFVLIGPAIIAIILAFFWANFWFFEIFFVITISVLSGLLVKFGTKDYFIDGPVLIILVSLVFYSFVDIFGIGEMSIFLVFEIIYNIVLGLVFYLLIEKMNSYIESIS